MIYKYATGKLDYSAFASGSVFASRKGMVGFPVRLMHELIGRSISLLKRNRITGPYGLYDPCCGTCVHLVCAAILYTHEIGVVAASDLETSAIEISRKNLALLTKENMLSRAKELGELSVRFNKDQYQIASENAHRLAQVLAAVLVKPTNCFRANTLIPEEINNGLGKWQPEIIFADLPYGQYSDWQGIPDEISFPFYRFQEVLSRIIHPAGIACIVTQKGTNPIHPLFEVKQNINSGKRRIRLLTLKNNRK